MAEVQAGQQQPPRSHQIIKACMAATGGGCLLVVSGLTLAGTVILLTLATPLLVIFSPVLVPAVITTFFLLVGFMISGAFGISAISVLTWIFRNIIMGPGIVQLDQARMKLAGKARELKERSEQQPS